MKLIPPRFQTAHHQRMSMTSNVSLALRRRGESTVYLGTQSDAPLPRYHSAPSRNEVAIVQPVLVRQCVLHTYKLSVNPSAPPTDQATRRRLDDRCIIHATRPLDCHETGTRQAMDSASSRSPTPYEESSREPWQHGSRLGYDRLTGASRYITGTRIYYSGLDMYVSNSTIYL